MGYLFLKLFLLFESQRRFALCRFVPTNFICHF